MYAAAVAVEGPFRPLPLIEEGVVGDAPAGRLPVAEMEVSRAGKAFEAMLSVEVSSVSVEELLVSSEKWCVSEEVSFERAGVRRTKS